GYRNRMHLVWNEIVIKYLSFPTVSPPLNASFAEWVYYTPPCGANFTGWPSIAVARRDSCDTTPPIIRVACLYYDDHRGTACPPANLLRAGVLVSERDPNLPLWNNGITYRDELTLPGNSPSPSVATVYQWVSVSLVANRTSSDFYLGYS